ncbi:MAG: hypothetical protein HW411_1382 [Gammaproteobacteria bacterium]|nr:hypothetical protein [Gammaproteobacteria bacterium]
MRVMLSVIGTHYKHENDGLYGPEVSTETPGAFLNSGA